MGKKSIIIDVTNGEGYTEPQIKAVDFNQADDTAREFINAYDGQDVTKKQRSETEMEISYNNGANGAVVSINHVDDDKVYLVILNPDMCTVFNIQQFYTLAAAKKALANEFSPKNTYWEWDKDDLQNVTDNAGGAHCNTEGYWYFEIIDLLHYKRKNEAVCAHCGSTEVTTYPECSWDCDKGDWVITGDIENGLEHCTQCDDQCGIEIKPKPHYIVNAYGHYFIIHDKFDIRLADNCTEYESEDAMYQHIMQKQHLTIDQVDGYSMVIKDGELVDDRNISMPIQSDNICEYVSQFQL